MDDERKAFTVIMELSTFRESLCIPLLAHMHCCLAPDYPQQIECLTVQRQSGAWSS